MNGINLPPTTGLAESLTAKAIAGATGNSNHDDQRIEKAAKDFEAVLLNRLMEQMEKTIPKSGLLDSNTTSQIRSMFWMHLAQDLSEKGGIGLWKDLQRQMSRLKPADGGDIDRPTMEHVS